MNHDQQENLDWVAQQYLLGELSPAESEQFEAQMADDEASCLALARAVEVMQVTLAAQPTVAHVPSDRPGRATWMAWPAVAAACLVCLAWFNSLLSSHNPEVGQRPGAAQPAEELALTWSETPDLEQAVVVDDSVDESVPTVGTDTTSDDDDSWVMVAVSGIEMHYDDFE